MISELRRELLAGGVGGADVLAAAALGARHRVDDLLPGQVGDGRRRRSGCPPRRRFLVEAQRLEPAPGARAPEVDVDARGHDVQVLGVGEVGEEAEDDQHVRPHGDALEHLRPVAVAEGVRHESETGAQRRRVLVQSERDPRRVPEDERHDDARDQREDQVGLAQVAAVEAPRPLHLADRERRRSRRRTRARRRGRRGTRTSPAGRATAASSARSTMPIIAITIVGSSTMKPQKIAACIRPGHEPLEQLALPEHHDRLVPHALWHVVERARRACPSARAARAGGPAVRRHRRR